jgi:hypothetical protein
MIITGERLVYLIDAVQRTGDDLGFTQIAGDDETLSSLFSARLFI